ncbi:MAG: PLP-dependent aminotransferase family protein [Thermomicrobiales bacterium]
MDLLIHLDDASTRTLRDQIYDWLRLEILEGRLAVGARLPSSRALASGLSVSRFTVTDAYNRLFAEGYVTGQHGSGTYVAQIAPVTPPKPDDSLLPEPSHRAWSTWSNRLSTLPPYRDPPPPAEIDLRHAVPELEQFPHTTWRRLLLRESKRISLETRFYGPTNGQPELRRAIADYLRRSRSIPCTPEQVLITAGTHEGVDLICRAWLDEGDCVAMEEPGYPRARRAFQVAGADIRAIPVDESGLDVDRLETLAPTAKLIYVTPSHQYPTGVVLSLPRRLALLEWAHRQGALVLEDDYDSEFRYGARPIPALAGLDATRVGSGSVVYVGTFSKVLYPSLRIGYLVVPPDMIERISAAKEATNRHAPYLEQATLASFISGGHFERHLNAMRKLYAERQSTLVGLLREELGEYLVDDSLRSAAGLHLHITLNSVESADEIAERALAVGLKIDTATSCFSIPQSQPSFLLGYASLDKPTMREGLQRFRSVL